jgi:hypothetical protein
MSLQAKDVVYRIGMNLCTVCVFALALAIATAAQECPKSSATGATVPSGVRTLAGRLIYHDGIRKWFELKLAQPQCEQTSIELVPGGRELQVLRGCRVRSKGVIGFSPTGYYSLDTYQMVAQIEPVGDCERQLPFPDYSNAKPDKSIRDYRVDMQIAHDGDHPIVFRVSSAGKELRPWQAYAKYLLTGGFVLYGNCGEGFAVDKVFGTAQANPSHFGEPQTSDDMAMFYPEDAVEFGKKDLHLGYTCVRMQ